jgi:hypothetical protein
MLEYDTAANVIQAQALNTWLKCLRDIADPFRDARESQAVELPIRAGPGNSSRHSTPLTMSSVVGIRRMDGFFLGYFISGRILI